MQHGLAVPARYALLYIKQFAQGHLVAGESRYCNAMLNRSLLWHGLLAATCSMVVVQSNIPSSHQCDSPVPQAPATDALRFLLAAMHTPQAVEPAASAFRNLCVRCAWRLRGSGVVQALVSAAHGLLLTPSGATLASHLRLISGSISYVSMLSGSISYVSMFSGSISYVSMLHQAATSRKQEP